MMRNVKFFLSLLAFFSLSNCEDQPVDPSLPAHKLIDELPIASEALVIKGSFFASPKDQIGGEGPRAGLMESSHREENHLNLGTASPKVVSSLGFSNFSKILHASLSSVDSVPINGLSFFQRFENWMEETREKTGEETGEETEEARWDTKELVISSSLHLESDTLIIGKKVFLNMAHIETFEHNLLIYADEFVSRHSVLRNFPPSLKIEKKQEGKNGGNVWILAKSAKGDLSLILNGLDGGAVPRRADLKRKDRKQLRGDDGANGADAVYKLVCRPVDYIFFKSDICQWTCDNPPEEGEPGENGHQGLPGFDGKRGGDSGSFLLSAFELDEFRFSKIEKHPGLGSPGGSGTFGGFPGQGGKAGSDRRSLCGRVSHRRVKGEQGSKGPHGKNGQNGRTGFVCLEKRLLSENQALDQNHICF